LVLLLLLLLWCLLLLLLLLLAWCSICAWHLKVALEVELAPVASSNCAVFCLARAAAQVAATHQVSKIAAHWHTPEQNSHHTHNVLCLRRRTLHASHL
jgi:hypothetical protein